MQRYNVTGHRPVLGYAPGEEVEILLSEEEENAHLAAGRLEIVPRDYRVIGPNEVHGAAPGSTLTAALPIGQEKALLGVHLERVDSDPTDPDELKGKSREDLDDLARALRVENPEALKNKGEVLDAINAAKAELGDADDTHDDEPKE